MTAKLKFKKGDLVERSNNHTRVPRTDLVMVLGYQGKAIKTWRADKEMGRLWTVIEPNGKKGVVWEDQLRKV